MKKLLLPLSLLLGVMATAQEQRVPLFEIFTSSTCPPCKPGNTIYENVVGPKPDHEYVSVKYQQNFPGSGDPYATDETVNRRSSYYAITSVPRMEIDGGWDQNAQLFTNSLYTSARNVPAENKLSGRYTLNPTTKQLQARLEHTPLTAAAAAAGTRLYVAILESETVQNVKSNGETEFFNVVKKMLPSETGTLLNGATMGQADTTNLTFTFAGNFRLPANGQTANRINHAIEHSVEDFANLRVVAWVQGSNKQVHQAANLMKVGNLSIGEMSQTIAKSTVFPNPASNVVKIAFEMKSADNISASILSMNGAVVAQKMVKLTAGTNEISFDTQALPNGYYNVVVIDSRNNSIVEQIGVFH